MTAPASPDAAAHLSGVPEEGIGGQLCLLAEVHEGDYCVCVYGGGVTQTEPSPTGACLVFSVAEQAGREACGLGFLLG